MERPVEFHALGSIELRLRGQEVLDVLAQTKRFSLFVLLALSPNRLYRRDTLVAMLWPELDASHARHALRQTLYYLRKHLDSAVFVIRGDELGIDPDRLWCDVGELDLAWERKDLEAVASLFRGTLLEGFHATDAAPEFDYWLDRERFRVRDRVAEAYRRLEQAARDRGDPEEVIRWARAQLWIDPADENALLALMTELEKEGNRGAAFEAYRSFVDQNGAVLSDQVEALARGLQVVAQRGRAARKVRPPSFPGSLIGRRRLIEQARALLADGVRLLTLTGPGGVGKTRLAIEIARASEDSLEESTAWASLAGIRDSERVPDAVAEAIGLEPRTSAADEAWLISCLEDRELLLVLDNFEHVLAAAPFVARLTQRCPALTVLVTSRSPLRVRGEQELDVPPLTLPDPARRLGGELPFDSEAVALFIDRVRAVSPTFRLTEANAGSVIAICHRLDGIPLAIELAARRTKIMSPAALASRLESLLPLLTSGPQDLPERQRALHDTIRWSVELLDPAEGELLFGLSVFVGGCDLHAAESVAGAVVGPEESVLDLLLALIDASLLRRTDSLDGEGRFAMLESIREYGHAELVRTGRAEAWEGAHARHYAAWVESGCRKNYCSPGESDWLARIGEDHDNLVSAMEWSLSSGEMESAARIAASIVHFWCVRGRLAEGRSWLDRILNLEPTLPEDLRARCLGAAAYIRTAQGLWDEAIELHEQVVAFRRAGGDRTGLATALNNLGETQREAGRLDQAGASLSESLAIVEELEDDFRVSFTLMCLGDLAQTEGRLAEARSLLEGALERARRIKHEAHVAIVLRELADVAREEGDTGGALRLLEEAARILEGQGREGDLAATLERLGEIREPAEPGAARALYARALHMYREGGYLWGTARVLRRFARIALDDGRPDVCVELLGGVEELSEAEARQAVELLERARRVLGQTTSAALRAAGRAMSLDRLLRRVDELNPAVEIPIPAFEGAARAASGIRTSAGADSAGAPVGSG